MNKQTYQEPWLRLIQLAAQDVITSSNPELDPWEVSEEAL